MAFLLSFVDDDDEENQTDKNKKKKTFFFYRYVYMEYRYTDNTQLKSNPHWAVLWRIYLISFWNFKRKLSWRSFKRIFRILISLPTIILCRILWTSKVIFSVISLLYIESWKSTTRIMLHIHKPIPIYIVCVYLHTYRFIRVYNKI